LPENPGEGKDHLIQQTAQGWVLGINPVVPKNTDSINITGKKRKDRKKSNKEIRKYLRAFADVRRPLTCVVRLKRHASRSRTINASISEKRR